MQVADSSCEVRVCGYVDRSSFVAELCRGRKVLDLGIVGETCAGESERVAAFRTSLHMRLAGVARELVGVDYAQNEITLLGAAHPSLHLLHADVEDMVDELQPFGLFEVVVAGDLIEHLANPGRVLDGIGSLVRPGGLLVVTTPNSFGAPNFIRFLCGRYEEGADHVLSHNKHTVSALLRRHGYTDIEVWTALDHWPRSGARRTIYRLGALLFKLVPELGGTLVVVCRRPA